MTLYWHFIILLMCVICTISGLGSRYRLHVNFLLNEEDADDDGYKIHDDLNVSGNDE